MCGKNNLGNLIHKNTMMHDQQASAATKSRQLFLKISLPCLQKFNS